MQLEQTLPATGGQLLRPEFDNKIAIPRDVGHACMEIEEAEVWVLHGISGRRTLHTLAVASYHGSLAFANVHRLCGTRQTLCETNSTT